jgi:hypothetical protein
MDAPKRGRGSAPVCSGFGFFNLAASFGCRFAAFAAGKNLLLNWRLILHQSGQQMAPMGPQGRDLLGGRQSRITRAANN